MTEPRYRRIASRLRDELRKGTWGEGETLPSQAELGEQFGVSLTTARHAVLELVKEGWLFTATNRGTIVRSRRVLEHVVTDAIRPDRPRLTSSDVFVETAQAAGRDATKEFSMRMEHASPTIAGWLGLDTNAWVVVRIILQLVDQEPWGYETSYYPRDLAEECGLDSPDDIPEGTTRRLRDRGYGETAWRDSEHARPATPDEADVLGVAAGTWIEDYVRIGATDGRVTRATNVRRMADKNRTIHELGSDQGVAVIRGAVYSENGGDR